MFDLFVLNLQFRIYLLVSTYKYICIDYKFSFLINSYMYIKVNAFNNARSVESCALSFIIQRPAYEPGFYLVRQEGKGRNIVYTIQSYAVQAAGEGSRY